MNAWARTIALATLVSVMLPVMPALGEPMESIARVTKLRRLRDRALAVRGPRENTPTIPHPLLRFIPETSPNLREPTHLAPMAERVERSMHEPVEVCVSVPPRHGKTTLLVHAIAWILLQNPRAQILYASYAHGFAAKQVRKAMRIAVRAGLRLGDTRKRDEWNTLEGGFVKACGVGGQITGEGFTHVFVDDPHKNRAEAESRQIRERVIDGFRDDIYTRQDPRGTSFFIVHTRWHEHDLTGEMIRPAADEDDAKPFEHVNLPALVAANDGTYRALAPDLFDAARLLKIQARLGEYSWASLYMGAPRPRGGNLFESNAVLIDASAEGGAWRYAIGVDLARTARTRSDYNVGVAMRQHIHTGATEVLEVIRAQCRLTETRRDDVIDEGFAARLAAMVRRYPGARAVMYTGGTDDALLQLLAKLGEHAVTVIGTTAEGDKHQRAQPYAAAWNQGRVALLRRAGWVNDFVLEHVSFTGAKGDRDDQVDAAAAAFDELERHRSHQLGRELKRVGELESNRMIGLGSAAESGGGMRGL